MDNLPNQSASELITRRLVGKSVSLQHVHQLIRRAASTDVNVLILGESGVGKEVVAKCLHHTSHRADSHFVAVNCGAIPPELLESELFGHEKGAFTGAYSARKGRFELAMGGTIFLDEIGDMPLAMQVKLLRVLQERCFERVGSNKSIAANVRIVAATHRNLEELIAAGKFREDLYYRLNVFPIEMPALRERLEDLPLLIAALIDKIGKEQQATLSFTSAALVALAQYGWPGNIRELSNLVERLMVLYPNGMIDVNQLPAKYRPSLPDVVESEGTTPQQAMVELMGQSVLPKDGLDLKEHLMNTESAFIKQALDICDGVVARAATYLSMRRTTLVEKMKKYDIKRTDELMIEEV